MATRFVFLAMVCVGSLAFGQEQGSSHNGLTGSVTIRDEGVAPPPVISAPPKTPGQGVPEYTPKPATHYSSTAATGVAAPTKADHLRIAAEHLEAAGFGKEAQDVRQKADAEQHSPTKTLMQQIVVNLRVVEFSRTKLGQVDSFQYGGKKGTSVLKLLDERVRTASTAGNESSAGRDLLWLIEAIAKNQLVMMVSEPSLVFVPGRPSCLRVGGEFAYRVKDSQGKEVLERLEYGTRLDLVCSLLSKELLHLDIRIAVKDLDYTNTIRVGDQTIPTLNGTECETSLTARSGQTCVLGSFISENQAQPRSDDKAKTNDHATDSQELAEKTQTLIFVTPELLEGSNTIKIGAIAKPSTR
ncbi:MAG: hypothetical protein ACLP9L_35440 [Thermoguttaceae bacterium]